jgi:hypothetical protein
VTQHDRWIDAKGGTKINVAGYKGMILVEFHRCDAAGLIE